MLRGISTEIVDIRSYKPGDPILETERISKLGSFPIPKTLKKDEKFDLEKFLEEALKPDEKEFKILSKGLKFLKYSEADAQELYNIIGGAIKLASTVSSVIGIVNSVSQIAEKFGLLGSQEKISEQRLKEIGIRVEQIYKYLAKQDKKGLYNEAAEWRVVNEQVQNAQWNARISRSDDNLDQLEHRASDLYKSISKMLDTNKADIAFQKSVYNYSSQSGHWIDAAGTSALTLADGSILPPYGAEDSDLQTNIWDAGHYIDVLVSALREYLIITMAMEPAYRSTAYDRVALRNIAQKLRIFVEKWRGSILIANPSAGINGGNRLYNPLSNQKYAAHGILIGAVDPVTGISSLKEFTNFKIEYSRTYFPGTAWGGLWDSSKASEPENALSSAINEHGPLVDSVIQSCGIGSLIKLEMQYRIAADSPIDSQFVRLPNAKSSTISNRLINPFGIPVQVSEYIGTPETIDLGNLKNFTGNPNKTYSAMRFRQTIEKNFKFKIARRTEMSKIQLGYRLRIADKDFILCPYSASPPEGMQSVPFPNTPIEVDYYFTTEVYDCCQTRHFSLHDEDNFEEQGENEERVFHNKRKGHGHIHVSISFEPFVGGDTAAHAGEVIVKIRNIEPATFSDAFILEVSVYETRLDLNGEPVELLADGMTIHMVPTYLVVGKEFIYDRRRALELLEKTVGSINDRFSQQELPFPSKPLPDPAWNIRDKAIEIENGLTFVKTAMIKEPKLTTDIVNHFLPPMIK